MRNSTISATPSEVLGSNDVASHNGRNEVGNLGLEELTSTQSTETSLGLGRLLLSSDVP